MKQSEIKTINLFSSILGKEMSIMVYLPGGYDNVTPVPVLYFHHGRNGNEHIMLDMKFFLDAGDQDEGGFYEGCLALYGLLQGKCISAQNHIFPGHHNVEYIKQNIEKYLKFYGEK